MMSDESRFLTWGTESMVPPQKRESVQEEYVLFEAMEFSLGHDEFEMNGGDGH